ARRPSITFVALEFYIGEALSRAQVVSKRQLTVWPHPISPNEACNGTIGLNKSGRTTIAYLGAVSRAKGFDFFMKLAQRCNSPDCEFQVIGHLYQDFSLDQLEGVHASPDALDRSDYLRQIRQIDYACLPFRDDAYSFTASGSLLDCVAQLKPIISTQSAPIRQ